MPGRPLRRARAAAARAANGEVAPPPRRLRAGLSPGDWRRLSLVEKLQSLYGLSLDAALEDFSYRGDDRHHLAARTSARHDVMMICAKYAIEMSRERDRQRILEELTRREFGAGHEALGSCMGKPGRAPTVHEITPGSFTLHPNHVRAISDDAGAGLGCAADKAVQIRRRGGRFERGIAIARITRRG